MPRLSEVEKEVFQAEVDEKIAGFADKQVSDAQRRQIGDLVAKRSELDILYDVQLLDGKPDSVTIFTRREADEVEG